MTTKDKKRLKNSKKTEKKKLNKTQWQQKTHHWQNQKSNKNDKKSTDNKKVLFRKLRFAETWQPRKMLFLNQSCNNFSWGQKLNINNIGKLNLRGQKEKKNCKGYRVSAQQKGKALRATFKARVRIMGCLQSSVLHKTSLQYFFNYLTSK